MQANQFSWLNFGIRFLIAFLLVFITYNPAELSFYHWALTSLNDISPVKVFAGLALLIGWVIYIRASLRSLGLIGISLALAFFATLFWMIIDWGIVAADSVKAITYIVEFILCLIMAVGISWSHVRRRISGQLDTDDIES